MVGGREDSEVIGVSPTMEECLAHAAKFGGVMERRPGGYWYGRGQDFGRYFGTSTIDALVSRGLASYTGWVNGRGGRFPIEARTVR
jgi:hypothetical protein